MENTYGIDELQKLLGLKEKFIRRMGKVLEDILKPTAGDKNKLLYNAEAFSIWQQIKRKKDEGLSIPSINDFIRASLSGQTEVKHEKTEEEIIGQTFETKVVKPKQSIESNNDQTATLQAKLDGKEEVIKHLETHILLLKEADQHWIMKRINQTGWFAWILVILITILFSFHWRAILVAILQSTQ